LLLIVPYDVIYPPGMRHSLLARPIALCPDRIELVNKENKREVPFFWMSSREKDGSACLPLILLNAVMPKGQYHLATYWRPNQQPPIFGVILIAKMLTGHTG